VTPIDPSAEIRALAGELYDELLEANRDLDSFEAQDLADLQAAALLDDVLDYAARYDAAALAGIIPSTAAAKTPSTAKPTCTHTAPTATADGAKA
jgi:hypothetical protein